MLLSFENLLYIARKDFLTVGRKKNLKGCAIVRSSVRSHCVFIAKPPLHVLADYVVRARECAAAASHNKFFFRTTCLPLLLLPFFYFSSNPFAVFTLYLVHSMTRPFYSLQLTFILLCI